MQRHLLSTAASLLAVVSLQLPAQTVRGQNYVPAIDSAEDTPAVQVWFEGSRVFSYGGAVRVHFRVSDDAYVIVARVDGNGHLTVLYPSNGRMGSQVAANRDMLVRSRQSGSFASFYATDRAGGGYVFALASYDPFDLSRLSIRDFDRYVTGMYVGSPTKTYIGDPHRVITRFADMVLYDQNTPFEYDVDFYSVDSPGWVSSSGFLSSCSYGYRPGLQERWDDELYYGSSAYSRGCDSWGLMSCLGAISSYYYYSSALPYCALSRGQSIARGPRPPVTPPGRSDSTKVAGWMADSIQRHGPDTVRRPVGDDSERGRQLTKGAGVDLDIVRQAGQRPPVVTVDESQDRVYSIPSRALRAMKRNSDAGGGAMPTLPETRTPSSTGDGDSRWMRPPRGVANVPSGDGVIPRGDLSHRGAASSGSSDAGAAGGWRGRDVRPPTRSDPPRYAEPPRNPRFEPTSPSSRSGGEVRNSSPRSEPTRSEPTRSAPQSAPPRVERPSPPPARERPAEKKPDKP